MEGTFVPVGVGGNHQEFSTGSPSDWLACLLESPVEDFLPDESGAGHAPSDPHSSGHTSNHSTAADAMEVNAAAGHGHGQGQPVPQLDADRLLDAHTEWDWTQINQLDADRLLDAYWTPINPDLSQIHTTHAAAEDIPPVVNAGPTHPQPDPYSTGDTTRCASTTADMEVNTAAGLPQSGGGGGSDLAEAAVQGSSKRKRLHAGSSSQTSTPPEFNMVELRAGLVQSDPSSTDIKPPAGSTDREILDFLINREESSMPYGNDVNLSLGEQDQMVPMAARSYVTTVPMVPEPEKTHHGYWKEKQVNAVRYVESVVIKGLKRTFQFHMYDGTKTNWFMHEYILTDLWGSDLYMTGLRFREVYNEGAEVPAGKPTSPEVKIKNKPAAAKKHRMREPENLVIKGESPVWQHFIKIYDRHPELEGSKVVYAVCCHCEGVLKASTGNGTNSLSTHCNRTCPIKNKNKNKNKNQQPISPPS